MSDPGLHDLARAAGIAVHWRDYRNQERTVGDAALHGLLDALQLPSRTAADRAESLRRLGEEAQAQPPLRTAGVDEPVCLHRGASGRWRLQLENGETREGRIAEGEPLPPIAQAGYHRLALGDDAPITLAVAPPRCLGMDDLGGRRRRWGLTAQVPSLRRDGDGGIGDFGSVDALAQEAARHGADAIGLSPAHAGFGAWPDRFTPYSPSSRLVLNPLLADPRALFEPAQIALALSEAPPLDEEFAALERLPQIDPGRATRARMALFRRLFERLDASGRRTDFDAWCRDAGMAPREHALFEALHRRFALDRDAPRPHWRDWPGDFRDPASAAVARFAREHAAEVEFGLFLQWLTERSLRMAQVAARDAGMAIGLIGDLAVGSDGAGSQAWSRQRDMLPDLRIGAPPDDLNHLGQDWGLTTLSPHAMRRHGFSAFIELLRANLRHVGGIRLDHVFGLQRLWLIPQGVSADQGGYLHYPLTDLLRLIALESHRHRALVIGEDLGTIPDGFQPQLVAAGLLGMRVMWFQRDGACFRDPARWERGVVAMTSTHDLPTVAGWWAGRDLSWRARLDLLEPGQDEARAQAQRAQDRTALWNAFLHAGVAQDAEPAPEDGARAAAAAAAFIGRTSCELALLPLEDALARREQPNIPGTTHEHPNWLGRLPADAPSLLREPDARATLAALQRERIAEGPA